MKDEIEKAEAFVQTEKMRLAAQALQYYMKAGQDQVTLDAILADLRQVVAEELQGAGSGSGDLDAMLVAQAKMLDATFAYFMNKSQNSSFRTDDLNMAMKAQRAAERTIKTLRHLKLQKEKIKKIGETK